MALFSRDASLRGGLLAGALFAAEFGCIFVGLQWTTASRRVVFIYLAPFVMTLGMPFVARAERLAATQWLGLLLAFAAVAGTFAESFSSSRAALGPNAWRGDALGVAAGVLWGVTTLVVRATPLAVAPAEKALRYQLGVSGPLLAAAAAWTLPDAISVRGLLDAARGLSAPALASLAFQIVLVAFASFPVWFRLVRHYPATRLSSFTLPTPLFGLALGAWLFDEPITPRLLLGLAGVAVGIVLVNQRPGRPRAARQRRPRP